MDKKISVIGTGIIGAGWATAFSVKGYAVTLFDISGQALESARNTIHANLVNLFEHDIIRETDIADTESLITYTEQFADAVQDAYAILESCPDKYEIKQEILRKVDAFAPAEALFLSSSSGLKISKIAEGSAHPERCVIAHPLNPPYLIPLVEICRGSQTSEDTLQRVVSLFKDINKVPVICQKEQYGYISNRLQWTIEREIASLVCSGVCTVEDADKVLSYGNGLRLAIFGFNLLFELGGGNNGIRGMKKMSQTRNAGMATLCNWDIIPQEWYDTADEGIKEEMLHMPDSVGHTSEEIKAFRDEMLIEVLKIKDMV